MRTPYILAMFCLLLPVPQARADVIELYTGQIIEAEVLKEQADAIYVDLGVDVIRIPLARIKSRRRSC